MYWGKCSLSGYYKYSGFFPVLHVSDFFIIRASADSQTGTSWIVLHLDEFSGLELIHHWLESLT